MKAEKEELEGDVKRLTTRLETVEIELQEVMSADKFGVRPSLDTVVEVL